jgi:ribosomal protein S18 acetylase RimI-like enzyme
MALTIQPMSEQDYQDWRLIIVPEYAQEKVISGAWTEAESLQKSKNELAAQLPIGLATPEHWLFTLHLTPGTGRVGFLWFARHENTAYLYDLYIAPEFRRQGHGRQAMQLFETAAKERGFTSMALHVFGDNPGARDLYLSAGYRITDWNMRKDLPEADSTTGS